MQLVISGGSNLGEYREAFRICQVSEIVVLPPSNSADIERLRLGVRLARSHDLPLRVAPEALPYLP